MIQPSKDKAKSYDDNFLDHVANSDLYKNWSSNKKNTKLATTNAFDTEKHQVDFDSSNQDELEPNVNPFLNQFVDLNNEDPYNELRAQNQSGLSQLGLGLGRTAVKAAVETAKLPGIISGLIEGTAGQIGDQITGEDNTKFIDTVFNNGWIKGLDNINEDIKSEYLPVYVKKAVQDGDLGDKIMSSAFWATDGADGAGFALGMILPGAMLGKLGLGAKMINFGKWAARIDKAPELFQGASRAEKFVNAASKIGFNARNIDSGISIGYNTAAEAGAEASQAGTEKRKEEPLVIKGWVDSGYLKTKEYENEVKKYLADIDLKRRNGNLTTEEANALTSDSLKVQEATLHQRFENEVSAMESGIMGRNAILLLGPNTLMHMHLFGRVGRTAEKIAEKGAIEGVETVGRMSKILNSGIVKGITKFGKVAGENLLVEGGWEEGLQTSTANQFKSYVDKNKAEEVGFSDTIPDTFTEYAKMLGTTEGQVSIMLGGVLGTGMTSISEHGKAKEEAKVKNEITNKLSIPMNNLNNIFNISDIYKKDSSGSIIYKKDKDGNPTSTPEVDLVRSQEVLRSLILTDDKLSKYKEAVDNGDNSYLDEQQNNAMFQLAKTAAYNGEKGLSLLKEQLDANSKLTDIQERDKNNDGSKKSYQEIVNDTMEMAKFLQKQNDKFQDFSGAIIKLEDNRLTDPGKAKLYRSVFLNELNSRYLKVQNKLRSNKAKLEQLKEKRSSIFNELGIDPLYAPNEEFPMANMKPGIINNEDLENRAKNTASAMSENNLVKNIEEEYLKTKQDIDKNNKDISEIWKGNLINDSFKDFVTDNLEEEPNVSEESIDKADDIISQINDLNNTEPENLDKIYNDNKDFIDNSHSKLIITNLIKEKKNKIANQKKLEAIDAKNKADIEDAAKRSENPTSGVPEVIINQKGKSLGNYKSESVLSQSNEELSPDGQIELEIEEQNELEVINDNNSSHVKVVNYNENTGQLIASKEYIEFERTPRDKKNDKITFEQGDENFNENAKKAVKLSKQEKALTEDELKFIESHYPIKVVFMNGKNSASSFIQGRFTKITKKDTEGQKDFEENILPLRKQIISHLIKNKSLDSIRGSISAQYGGQLQMDNKNEIDGSTAINSVFKLAQFEGMSQDQKIKYFQDNAYYSDWRGKVKNCFSGNPSTSNYTSGIKSKNKGEIFLLIDKANGEKFPLKLNINNISESQGNDLMNLIKIKFEGGGNDILLSKIENLAENSPSLSRELKLIRNTKKFAKDESVDRLIDLLIFNGNENKVTGFDMVFDDDTIVAGQYFTGIKLGDLFAKLRGDENPMMSNISIDEFLSRFDNPDFKQNFLDFFKYKRHNVLIGKDPIFNFKNKEYLNYLLNEESPVLSTNAIVNEGENKQPTFQGKTNIFLNSTVTSTEDTVVVKKKKIPVKKEVVAQQDMEDKKSDVEKRINDTILAIFGSESLFDFSKNQPGKVVKGEFIPDNLGEQMFEAMNKTLKGEVVPINKAEAVRLFKEYAKIVHPDKNTQSNDRQIIAEAFFKAMSTAKEQGRVDILNDLKNKYDAEIAALESKSEVKTNEQKVAEYRAAEKVENSEIEKRKQEELNQLSLIPTSFDSNGDISRTTLRRREENRILEEEINAKYSIELAKVYDRYDKLISPLLLEDKAQENIGKEITAVAPFNKGNITGKIVSVVENKAKKGLYSITLDNGEKVSGSFEDNKFTWVQNEKEVSKEKTTPMEDTLALYGIISTLDNEKVTSKGDKIVSEGKISAKELELLDKSDNNLYEKIIAAKKSEGFNGLSDVDIEDYEAISKILADYTIKELKKDCK